MKLCREIKQDETFIDFKTSGSWMHVIAWDDITPSNYENVTDIEYIHENKEWLLDNGYINDCDVVQNFMLQICTSLGWANLTDDEKMCIIDYNGYDNDTTKIIFLMGKGYSQLGAINYLTDVWSVNNDRLIASLQFRFPYVKKVLGKRIVKNDLDQLILNNEGIINRMLHSGVLGINYGSSIDGIMDYLESTNGYINNGISESNYSFINSLDTWEDVVSDTKDVLWRGKYVK